MVNIQLKIVEEGLKHPLAELQRQLTHHLFEDDIIVRTKADLTLKIKFTRDHDQDLILLQLRETESKAKLGEKVIHYIEKSWVRDTIAESHALLAPVAVVS
jgi:hypothetical protein